jgi:serine/threonine protein kinase
MVGHHSSSDPQWSLPDGEDTRLARELHARGLVEVGALQTCLEEVRRGRTSGLYVALAGVLLERRLVDAQALSQLCGPGRGSSQDAALQSTGTRPVIPQQLGNYRLGRQLGRGGMGAVYEAQHVVTGQRYALKLMDLDLLEAGDAESLERFRREARLGSRLEHPNVVAVVDADLDSQIPWIVQELLPGETLLDQLRQTGCLEWPRAIEVLLPIADALAHAHERGVLHRDLKPSNILLDQDGRPRLGDFGLARESGGQALRLTMSGEAVGTPNYMAPEQATGARVQGPALDVYGFCAVLYQVLTGHPPFQGASLLQTLQQIVQDPAPRVSASVEVPRQLDDLIAQALAKAPGDRPANGGVLADELRACLAAEEQEPAKGSGGLVGVGLFLGVGVLVGLLWLIGREGPPAVAGASPTPSSSRASTPEPSPSAVPLSASTLGAPSDWTSAWQLDPGQTRCEQEVLWAEPGRVADPLGALERPGGAEALFLGDPAPAGPERWRVRYAPRRGLIRQVGRHPGFLIRQLRPKHGLDQPPPFRWLGAPEARGGQALVGCPNDGGDMTLSAGRGLWQEARVAARLSVEPIDRGSVFFRVAEVAIQYQGRSQQLSRGRAVARLKWSQMGTLTLEPTAEQGRLRFEDQAFDDMVSRLEAPPRVLATPRLSLTEGWFLVDSIVVEGRPLQGDRAALAEPAAELAPLTHFAWGIRYRIPRSSPGGPCLDLGRGRGRLRLSASQAGLRLFLGERLLRRQALPDAVPAEGVLSLVREGDVVKGRLAAGERTWSLSCAIPLPLRGPLSYGSTGPRLEIQGATLLQGPTDPERLAHDEGGPPSQSHLGKWRSVCWELEDLFDPLRLDPALRSPQGARRRGEAFLGLAKRLGEVASKLPLPQRRDALARALVAAVYAGQPEAAQIMGRRLAAEGPARGREVVAWLGGGGLADLMKSGLRIATQAPMIARAGARGVRPLVSEGERAQVDWTLLHTQRLEAQRIRRARPFTTEEVASLAKVAEELEGVRARGYAGPGGREVGLDLAWVYEVLNKPQLYRARVEEVLATRSGGVYSHAWLGYARSLQGWGELEKSGDCLIAALARGGSNRSIRAGVQQVVHHGGNRWPPAQLAAVAWVLSQVSQQDALRWRQFAINAAKTAVGQGGDARSLSLAGIVLLRLVGKLPPGLEPGPGPVGQLLKWFLADQVPSPEELRAAIASDRLVEHLALLDPRYAGLLER